MNKENTPWEQLFDERFVKRDNVAEFVDVPYIAGNPEEIKSFIRELIAEKERAVREELNDCSCKEKWTFGVVHQKDKPCYWPTAHGVARSQGSRGI